jgi:Phosphodiester glycosidase
MNIQESKGRRSLKIRMLLLAFQNKLRVAGLITSGLALLGGAYFYSHYGSYGLNVLRLRGGSVWLPVEADDHRLTASMRTALASPEPEAHTGALTWTHLADGFDAAELPVFSSKVEVDRILLARINPEKFRFSVVNAPAGKLLDEWMTELSPAFIINGSYFAKDGTPDTPLLSGGKPLGPATYEARHGAFVADGKSAGVIDLAKQSWMDAFRGADDAMVSYPMLIGADGNSRVSTDQGWLANRSFVADDKNGNIILGTTKDAFFTLSNLAKFLKSSPLELRSALNLDGGPVACQGIQLAGFSRHFCGSMELANTNGKRELLRPALIPGGKWAMTIVLAVTAK